MNGWAAGVTCIGTKSDKETTHSGRCFWYLTPKLACGTRNAISYGREEGERPYSHYWVFLGARASNHRLLVPSLNHPLYSPLSVLVLLLCLLLYWSAVLWCVPCPLACITLRVWAVGVRWLPVSMFTFLLSFSRRISHGVRLFKLCWLCLFLLFLIGEYLVPPGCMKQSFAKWLLQQHFLQVAFRTASRVIFCPV